MKKTARPNERGVSIIEFTLALPVLILLSLGTVDVARLFYAQQRLDEATTALAHRVANSATILDESDIDSLMKQTVLSLENIGMGGDGRLILSSLTLNESSPPEGHWLRWQRCVGAKRTNVHSSVGREGLYVDGRWGAVIPTVYGLTLHQNENVIVAEAIHDYRPLFFTDMIGVRLLRAHRVARAKIRQLTELSNVRSLSGSAMADCSLYSPVTANTTP